MFEWQYVPLGEVTCEGKERCGEADDKRRVYGVDRRAGLTPSAKYQAKDLKKYKVLRPGMFAYNPMRLNIGSIAYCSENHGVGLVSPDYVVFGCDKEQVDPEFFRYLIEGPEWRRWTTAAGVGSVRVRIYYSELARMPLSVPPLPEQRAIASILGALDDKIELNRRMNATLESLARAIFKSWFVDFDPVRWKNECRTGKPENAAPDTAPFTIPNQILDLFPATFQDSELGKIPEGWEVRSISKAMEVNPKRMLARGTVAKYLDMKSMPTQGHRPAELICREMGSGTKFVNGDTLMARITPCLENGKTAFVDFLESDDEVAWGSTEYIVLRPLPPLPEEFGYFLARDEDFRLHAIQNMTGSSGRQRVQTSCFDSYLIAVPDETIATEFAKVARPLMAEIRSLAEESLTLASLRDTLLPKLLSGELPVPEALKAAEEAVS